MIPQVDVNIVLGDTGYKFRTEEISGSVSLGQNGFRFPSAVIGGEGGFAQNFRQTFFPAYNTDGDIPSDPLLNYDLGATMKTSYSTNGVLPNFNLWSFDGTNFLAITWDTDTGAIQAKITTWPGDINYSTAGMTTLTITNEQPISFGGIAPCMFDGNEPGFILWGLTIGAFDNVLLPIRLNLATPTTWVADPMAVLNGLPCVTFQSNGINYYADFSANPTIAVSLVNYDVSGVSMVVSIAPTYTGDVSTDAANGLLPNGWNSDSFYYVGNTSPFGGPAVFGIDYVSGNNTGCWYCRLDCTKFGQVTFTMPDASIGPSSSPTVYWVQNTSGNRAWKYYPLFDLGGSVFWLRPPLIEFGGAYVLEPETGEMYAFIVAPPAPTLIPVLLVPPTPYILPFKICGSKC